MRKALLAALTVVGVGLLTMSSASTAPSTGAAALLNAAQECATANVEEVAWRCRRRCWRTPSGAWRCQRRCWRY